MSNLIDRQKAIEIITSMMRDCFPEAEEELDAVVTTVREIPSAETERKKGKWIIRYYDMESYQFKEVEYNPLSFNNPCGITYCSECGAHPLLNGHEEDVYSKFCPNCGADMRGE